MPIFHISSYCITIGIFHLTVAKTICNSVSKLYFSLPFYGTTFELNLIEFHPP